MKNKRYLTHASCVEAALRVAGEIIKITMNDAIQRRAIFGVPRGGIPAAYLVSRALHGSYIVTDPREAHFIIDDIVDSGTTADRYINRYPSAQFFSLFPPGPDWLVFPWEVKDDGADESATDIPLRLLEYIGENPEREGLKDTPKRFLQAWKEYTGGYLYDGKNLKEELKTFTDGAEKVDELILIRNIPVYSHCEHHLAAMFGVAHVGYLPNGKVLGLSKFVRLVNIFAHRLQVQERLTQQIANGMNDALEPLGVGVVLELRHLCMEQRGVRAQGSSTTTSCMLGALKDKPAARAEFLGLVR